MDLEGVYESEEDLHLGFDRLRAVDIEEIRDQKSLEDLVKQSVKCQKSIANLNLFSRNEDLKDINVENYKFIALPFIMGKVFGQMMENRMNNIKMSGVYYKETMKLLVFYELVDQRVEKQWKQMESKERYQISRDDKISNYKEQKQILGLVDKLKDDSDKKEHYMNYLRSLQYEILSAVQLQKEEMEMLKFRQKMEQDQKVKEDYENRSKNIPKLQSVNIPKMPEQVQINSQQIQQEQKGETLCGDCMKFGNMDTIGINNQQIKQELQSRVFQPGHSVPTMRLEDFAEHEMELMRQQEQAQQQAKLRQVEVDEENEDYIDQKTYEQRAWDDWKDANEKGAGNKGGRR